MSLEINIEDDFAEVGKTLDAISAKYAGAAARFAINRTLLTLRKEAILEITKHLKIKPSTLREKYISLQKARGSRLGEVFGVISFSGKPISLINFVIGNRGVTSQAGIAISRRRKIKVEVTPGARYVVSRAFILPVPAMQLFKRRKGGIYSKQSVPSLKNLIEKKDVGKTIAHIGQERFRELFLIDLKRRIEEGALKIQKG